MPRNGSGSYSLPSGNPVTTGTTISSTWANTTLSDIGTALTTSIASDGQTTPTANLPMGGFKLTGLAAGTTAGNSVRYEQTILTSGANAFAADQSMGGFKLTNLAAGVAVSDAARVSQIQNASFTSLTAVAGTNTITATATPTPAAYVVGQVFQGIAAATNTGATTLNISGLGAGAVQVAGNACVGGEFIANAPFLVYVSAVTPVFQIIASGAVPPFLDTNALVKGSADGTKKVRFEVDGLTTATTRVLTVQDADYTLIGTSTTDVLSNKTIAAASNTFNLAPITNSIAGDVNLNNTANYFDGPSIAQGTSGTWFVSGTVTINDPTSAAAIHAKLWDGTTVIASALQFVAVTNQTISISLSGYLASPAGNLRISVKDATNNTGVMKANTTGNSKDSTISAFRIA